MPLLGWYKGEQHSRYHLTPLAAKTDSGIHMREMIHRVVGVNVEVGRSWGPAFGHRDGSIIPSRVIKCKIMDTLQTMKDIKPGTLSAELDCYEDFGISCSFRRGATSTARTRGVSKNLIDLIN